MYSASHNYSHPRISHLFTQQKTNKWITCDKVTEVVSNYQSTKKLAQNETKFEEY